MPRRRVVSRSQPSEPEPGVQLIGDAALRVLRAGRAVAGGSGDAPSSCSTSEFAHALDTPAGRIGEQIALAEMLQVVGRGW